jgi:3-hydroxyisobutyrate dehydrogenase-like beta-hydroxyacid dehydrogenase
MEPDRGFTFLECLQMPPVVAIVAPGAMGAGLGRRLAEHGLQVLTSLSGRSEASAARAGQSHMRAATDAEIVAADLLLSVVPPGEAVALAERFAPLLRGAVRKPLFVDCNAVNPETAFRIGEVLGAAACPYVDASIIGLPPVPGKPGPRIYAAGADAVRFGELAPFGLDIRVLKGPIGAASALKMSYAGCTKGLIALGSAMMLAAERAGAAEALRQELADSQPHLLAWFTRMVPTMYSKAHRFVGEMEEIAGFVGEDRPEHLFFAGAAGLYTRLAKDHESDQRETGALTAFLHPPE